MMVMMMSLQANVQIWSCFQTQFLVLFSPVLARFVDSCDERHKFLTLLLLLDDRRW